MPHILGNKPLGKENLLKLFEEAERLREHYYSAIDGRYYLSRFLEGKAVLLLFIQPSTRTRLGFQLAAECLGARTILFESNTSMQKGETLEDTIRTLAAFPQTSAIVMRHPEKGAAERAAATIERLRTEGRLNRSIPVINAGDGPNWHPTQAYKDIYTLWRHKKLRKGRRLQGVIFGDLTNARVLHSLILELSPFRPKLYLVSPADSKLPPEVYKPAAANGAELVKVARFQKRMVQNTDFYYFIRLQDEYLADKTEEEKNRMRTSYNRTYGCSPEIRQLADKNSLFMHPGPMRDAIPEEAKWDSRLVDTEQIENGLWVNAALLNTLLTRNPFA